MRPKLSEAEQPNAVIYSGELHKHHSVPSLFRSHNLLGLPTTQTESQGLFSCQVGEGDVKHKISQF